MNIELDEVVELNVSDDALELASGCAGGNWTHTVWVGPTINCC